MGHTSGLSGWQEPIATETLYDWERSTALLAAQAPWWEPGTASGYHSGSYGHLVGELVRRASGSATFGMALRELVTGPLALDVHVGLPGGQHSRVARSAWASGDGADGPSIPPGSMAAAMAQLSSVLPDINDPRHWAEEWPSRNGLGTARALAKCYDAVGGTFFPKEVRAALAQSQGRGVDLVLSMFGVPDEVEWGLGVFRNGGQLGPGAETFGHPGAGGCTAFTDPDHRLSFAFTTNHLRDQLFGMDPRAQLLIRAVYDAL
jgi:CubicO group peptidase (beta-lactamase class C family)